MHIYLSIYLDETLVCTRGAVKLWFCIDALSTLLRVTVLHNRNEIPVSICSQFSDCETVHVKLNFQMLREAASRFRVETIIVEHVLFSAWDKTEDLMKFQLQSNLH